MEEHVFGAERSLISIYLELRERPGLRILGAPGGWGLAVADEPPRAYDLAEYGRVEIGPADGLLGRAHGEIVTVWTVHAPGEPIPVGIRWSTASGADVVVYAYDDTLLLAPPGELELDGVTFIEVC